MDSGIPRPKCDILEGDKFVFIGNYPQEELRIIRVSGVSVTGQLAILIDMPSETPRVREPISMAYSEALLMIEQGIWMEAARARKIHGILVD